MSEQAVYARQGDPKTFTVLVLDSAGDPVDLAGVDEVVFYAWRRPADPVVKKILGDGVELVIPTTDGKAAIRLDENDTASLLGQYRYEVFTVTAGDPDPVLAGPLYVSPSAAADAADEGA